MRYLVLQPMTLQPTALLGLTAEQAAARAFGLVPEGSHWRVVKPVGFKAGETLECLPALPKQLAHAAQPLAAARRKPARAEA
jgi:hypothetical protein